MRRRIRILFLLSLTFLIGFEMASPLEAWAATRTAHKTKTKKRVKRKSTARKTVTRRATAKRKTSSRPRKSRRVAVRRSRRWRPAQSQPTKERYAEIQSALQRGGFLATPPNGEWDDQSVEALKRFQQEHDLSPTGRINSLSLIALGLGPKHNFSRIQADAGGGQ